MSASEKDILRADLSAYLDGELDAERVQVIEEWLTRSPDARRLLDELREMSDQLGSLPHVRAPETLAAAMSRQAERQLLLGPEQSRPPRTLRLVTQFATAAAVLLACGVVGYEVLRPHRSAPPATPSAAPTLRTPAAEQQPAIGPSTDALAAAKPADSTAFGMAAEHGTSAELAKPAEPASPVVIASSRNGKLGAPSPTEDAAYAFKVAPGVTEERADRAGGAGGVGGADDGTTLNLAGIGPFDYELPTNAAPVAGELTAEPALVVSIRADSDESYVSNAALLQAWNYVPAANNQSKSGVVDGPPAPFDQQSAFFGRVAVNNAQNATLASQVASRVPVEQNYAVDVRELNSRLGQLLDNNAPSQVDVSASFNAADPEVAVQVSQALQQPRARQLANNQADRGRAVRNRLNVQNEAGVKTTVGGEVHTAVGDEATAGREPATAGAPAASQPILATRREVTGIPPAPKRPPPPDDDGDGARDVTRDKLARGTEGVPATAATAPAGARVAGGRAGGALGPAMRAPAAPASAAPPSTAPASPQMETVLAYVLRTLFGDSASTTNVAGSAPAPAAAPLAVTPALTASAPPLQLGAQTESVRSDEETDESETPSQVVVLRVRLLPPAGAVSRPTRANEPPAP